MLNLKEIYEKELEKSETRNIESSHFKTKPTMNKGIISDKSNICIQPVFGIDFSLDKEGMDKVITMFENRLEKKSEEERKNLLNVLFDIYGVTEEYLGGHGINSNRELAYLRNSYHLNLSQIEGRNIGLCAERAAMGHQMLAILNKAGLSNFESYFVSSHMTIDGKRDPHAFILIQNNKGDSSRQYIFDIENPLRIKSEKSEKIIKSIGLYYLTDEEYNSFIEGKNISPSSIYEKMGMEVLDKKRYYGDEEIKNKEEIEK